MPSVCQYGLLNTPTGAILRYKVNFEQLADVDDEDEFYDGTFRKFYGSTS